MALRFRVQNATYRFPRTGGASILSTLIGRHERTAPIIENVSFDLECGEILGIIGSNGSGKSTLLRILAGIYPVVRGSIISEGKVTPVIDLGAGLKPLLSLKENLFLICALYGLSYQETVRKAEAIVSFAGLEGRESTRIFQFSKGMEQRLVFSIALHCDPDILLLDEIFAVGDVEFRAKSLERIRTLLEKGGSVVLVGHDLNHIQHVCDRVIWLDRGSIRSEGDPKTVCQEYERAATPR